MSRNKSEAQRQLDELRQQQMEIEFNREKILQRLEDFPRQQEEKMRKRQEFIKERAKNTETNYLDWAPHKRLHSVTKSASRMSKSERRSAITKLLVLCVVPAGLVLILLKAVR